MKKTILLILLITNLNALDVTDSNNLTFDQLGMAGQTRDGPLTGVALEKTLQDAQDRQNGIDTTKSTVIVQIPDSMRSKKIGKTRISGDNLKLVFPTDKQYKQYIDTDREKAVETSRLDTRKQMIADAEASFSNPFMNILQYEQDLNSDSTVTKHLLQLAVEREQEIYDKSVNNELGEIKERRFNRGLLNPLMKSN
jgi:hypothetical protein